MPMEETLENLEIPDLFGLWVKQLATHTTIITIHKRFMHAADAAIFAPLGMQRILQLKDRKMIAFHTHNKPQSFRLFSVLKNNAHEHSKHDHLFGLEFTFMAYDASGRLWLSERVSTDGNVILSESDDSSVDVLSALKLLHEAYPDSQNISAEPEYLDNTDIFG